MGANLALAGLPLGARTGHCSDRDEKTFAACLIEILALDSRPHWFDLMGALVFKARVRTTHLSTADAKAKGCPGSDVYRFSHLLYFSDNNRDAGVAGLCREAHKAFSDTIMIHHRHVLSEEEADLMKWGAAGGIAEGLALPPLPITFTQFEWRNFENLKIAVGFELTLKAMLLEKDYIVQEINNDDPAYKTLSVKQKKRPIPKVELFSIDQFRFDGQLNYLPGLRSKSLKFSTIVQKPDYQAALGLPSYDLGLIDEFRALRNQIHFPGDPLHTPKLQAHPAPIRDFVVDFINREIVPRANQLTEKHKLSWTMLEPLA